MGEEVGCGETPVPEGAPGGKLLGVGAMAAALGGGRAGMGKVAKRVVGMHVVTATTVNDGAAGAEPVGIGALIGGTTPPVPDGAGLVL